MVPTVTATFTTSNETFSVSKTPSLSSSKVEDIEEESPNRKESISGNRIIDVNILLVVFLMRYMFCPKCLSAVHQLFMKDLRENKDYHHCCIWNALPVSADIFKNSSLQQKCRGFQINQQIVHTMGSSVSHGYAGIQKFNTPPNIPKQMTIKTITKKSKKR